MSIGRRFFMRSVAVGSTACLVGCDGAPAVTPPDDGGVEPCRPQPPRLPAGPTPEYPGADYFDRVAADLDEAGIGAPVVLLDLDRMDGNIDAIASGVAPLSYRIVEKSLPSLDLLAHVAARSGSDKFLVMHLPFLTELLTAFPDAEMLMGKTHLASAIGSFFQTLPTGTDRAAVAARVVVLADGPERLAELIALATSLGVTLRVAIEIDVGLRRSGLADPSELAPMLRALLETSAVELAGFLGYDGHVGAPDISHETAEGAWSAATAAYQSFVDVLNEPEFAALAALPDLIFHSGGTATYPTYGTDATPVNDVAAGGGVLRPGAYPNHFIEALKPAIFIATPVLRVYSSPELPFLGPTRSASLLRGRQGLTIYGGGWPAYFTHPPDIQPPPLASDATDHVMVPNQGMVTAPEELAIEPGDWIFYHPRQSDALFQFERIHLVRGGRVESGTWAAFPRRY